MKSVLLWPAIILASATILFILVLVGAQSALRPWLAFWFLLICPGMAFIPLLGLRVGWLEPVLGLALSLAIDTTVAEVLVLAHLYAPTFALAVIIGISLIGVALRLTQLYRLGNFSGRVV